MEFQLDLERFWAASRASGGKPFCTDKPMIPVGVSVDDHWLLEEMNLPSTVRYYEDFAYRGEVNKECNDRLQAAIGIRPFPEHPIPGPRRIEELFGSRVVLTEGGTPWLEPGIETIEDLQRVLDRVEETDLQAFTITEEWQEGREWLRHEFGQGGGAGGGSRGPATIGTSVCGTERYLMFLMDYPEVMARFHDLLAQKMIEQAKLLREVTGAGMHGYGFADDNCALLSPSLYREFCYPVLKKVFDFFSPNPGDGRFQHSDSAMGHLMPMLNELGLTGANFGPTIRPSEIREAMPKTVIHGQIPPMTLRNGTPEEIIAAVRRDIDAVGADGGLVLNTAGSVSAGTSLENLRIYLWAAWEYGRYQ